MRRHCAAVASNTKYCKWHNFTLILAEQFATEQHSIAKSTTVDLPACHDYKIQPFPPMAVPSFFVFVPCIWSVQKPHANVNNWLPDALSGEPEDGASAPLVIVKSVWL